MDPATMLVFHCHHGERSRAAAHHFVQQGFTNVYNVTDGIDGWSLNVDPSVRRY
jgi:monothiol glutaredoxin